MVSKARQTITILGSTGSIGISTLDVIRLHPERFLVFALCAHQQIDRLFAQCMEFRPRFAVLADAALAKTLQSRLKDSACSTEVLHGSKALEMMASAPEVDTVMAAIVGAAGLASTLAAAQQGKKILLANKEALVMAGAFFMQTVRQNKATLLPIDSEHNAIFQSLPCNYSSDLSRSGVAKIMLTASGGPFRKTPLGALNDVTPNEACAHPKWAMGRKISVDSATLMNKGLELIEAHWLFTIPPEKIEVVIHPESIIHSLVQYIDGSVIAELGNPDMRTPIAHALAYPERMGSGVADLDLFQVAALHFERPDTLRFPALDLAFQAISCGGNAPAVLNAANEIAVQAFLEGRIRFTAIAELVANTLDQIPVSPINSLAEIIAIDSQARQLALQLLNNAR